MLNNIPIRFRLAGAKRPYLYGRFRFFGNNILKSIAPIPLNIMDRL